MNLLKISTNWYSHLHCSNKLVDRFIASPLRFGSRKIINRLLKIYLNQKDISFKPKSICNDVIISLTSFPARIDSVWMVIECMLRQTYQPHLIILWLSKDQFPTDESIPSSLRERKNLNFQIRIVDGDIRSHKKYYYAFQEFPNHRIITVDDDIFYSSRLIEDLVRENNLYPNEVCCKYGSYIGYDDKENLLKYTDWTNTKNKSNDFFFGSGGGVIFRPSLLAEDLLKSNLFMSLTPTADDVWLNAMIRLSRLRIRPINNGLILPIEIPNSPSLFENNIGQNQNDVQLNNVIEYYKKKNILLFIPNK